MGCEGEEEWGCEGVRVKSSGGVRVCECESKRL